FKFICPTDLPANGIRIKSYFNPDIDSTDLPAVGMALYENCDSTELPLICFSSNKPEDNFIDITSLCLMPDHSYFVRIWSTGITSSTEGTFKVGIFPVPDDAKKPVWWETFNGGLEKNGWTTEGTCAIADSNQNSGWVYIPTGLIDKGAYIFHGASLVSESICDGAVGVDSDFLDNFGDPNNAGSGPCPAPSQHILISPEINTSTWGGRSVYIQWDQAIRNYESTYYYSIRTRDEGGSWSDWKDYQINIEFVTNGNFISHNIQQHPLPGSQGHKFIQIRFIYNANYYLWAIDDVKLIPAVANNDLAITFGGVTPWVSLPADQTFPYCTKIDLYNEGFTPQTHAKVANTIINTGTSDTIYQWHTSIDTIWPGQEISSLQQNELIEIPPIQGTYFSAYSATQDQP
ncbi:MAG TPA: hypothetical protein VJ508_09240, partial [Saprospiraceae bacterium]|nr:hypothetical protein [Saprospiraceae bacterium]